MTAGDISEGEIEKAISRPGETKINRERGNEETVRMALRRQNERGKGASEMPGAPIKIEIGGFANVNPTSRRLGGKKQRAEHAFMNSAGWELGVRGRTAGF